MVPGGGASFFLARRYFFSQKNFYSRVFSLLAILGIAMGVFTMVVVLSVMKGFEETVRDRILGINAHMLVFPPPEAKGVLDALKGIEGVRRVFPYVQSQAMAVSDFGSSGCVLRGVGDAFFRYFGESGWLKKGRIPSSGEVIVGYQLSRRLGITVGDSLRFISSSGEFYLFGFVPKVRSYRVSGIFNVGLYDFDSGMVFGRLADVMDFLGVSHPSGYEMDVDRPDRVEDYRKKVESAVPGSDVVTWKELNRNLFSAMKLERITMFIILSFMACVASFSVVASLFLNVIERKRDIAVLRAFGATASFVKRVFLWEGLFLGVVGSVIGFFLSFVVVELVERYKLVRLPADVYLIPYLPAKFPGFWVGVIIAFSLLISVMGAVIPARWASRLDPSEILRFE